MTLFLFQTQSCRNVGCIIQFCISWKMLHLKKNIKTVSLWLMTLFKNSFGRWKIYGFDFTGRGESPTYICNLRAYFCNFHVFPKKLVWAQYPHIDLMCKHKSVLGDIDLKSTVKISIDLIFSLGRNSTCYFFFN